MIKKKILIVDDDNKILSLLRASLMTENFEILTAHTGEECLRDAKTDNPDVIILDITLPGKDGTEVASELKNGEKTKHIPVIFLTGLVDKHEEKEEGSLGKCNYIFAKPFEVKELLAAITKLTSNPKH